MVFYNRNFGYEENKKSIFEQGGIDCVCCAPNNPVGLDSEFWEEGEDVLTIWIRRELPGLDQYPAWRNHQYADG